GTGINISAFNAGGDKDASNDIANSTVDVLDAPAGFEVAEGSVFQGRLNAGDVSSPDLIEVGKTNMYDLLAPSTSPHGDYASTWDVASVTAFASGGLAVPPSDYVYTAPTKTSNGMISFTGLSKYLDSIVI